MLLCLDCVYDVVRVVRDILKYRNILWFNYIVVDGIFFGLML